MSASDRRRGPVRDHRRGGDGQRGGGPPGHSQVSKLILYILLFPISNIVEFQIILDNSHRVARFYLIMQHHGYGHSAFV